VLDDTTTLSDIGATVFSGYPVRVSVPRTVGWREATCVTSVSLLLLFPARSYLSLVSAIRECERTFKRNVLLPQLNVSGLLRKGTIAIPNSGCRPISS